MGARVPLVLRVQDGVPVKTTALLNSGFESEEPHLLIPRAAAEKLYPAFPEGAVSETIGTAGGDVEVLVLPEPAFARVTAEDREGPEARVTVFVSDVESEILVSDAAIDALGVEIKSPGKGLWRFAGENPVRPSAPRTVW